MTKEDHAPFTHIVESWLDSPDDFLDPDTVLDRVMAQVDTRPQHRARWPEWRSPLMNKYVTIGLGAAAVVVVLLVGSNMLRSSSSPPGGAPSESAASSGDGSLPVGLHVMNLTYENRRATVTIPAPGWFAEPDGSFLTKDLGGDDRVTVVVVPRDRYRVPADMCGWQSSGDIPVTDSVDSLLAALAAQTYAGEGSPTREFSTPVDITIDGFPAQSMASVVPVDPDSDPDGCDEQRFCSLMDRDGVGCLLSHLEPGALDTIWMVEWGSGPTRVLAASYWPTTSTELLAEMNAIVESIIFLPGTP